MHIHTYICISWQKSDLTVHNIERSNKESVREHIFLFFVFFFIRISFWFINYNTWHGLGFIITIDWYVQTERQGDYLKEIEECSIGDNDYDVDDEMIWVKHA